MIWQESRPKRSKPGKPRSRKQHGSSRSMLSAASNMPNSSGAWLRGRNKEECLGRKPNRDRHRHQPDAAVFQKIDLAACLRHKFLIPNAICIVRNCGAVMTGLFLDAGG